jgi:hypothetical protein
MRNLQTLAEFEHPVEHRSKGFAVQVEHARDHLELRLNGRTVVQDDVRQDHCIRQPVVSVEERAHRMRERVHAAQSLLERGGAHAGGRQHARARLDVAAVFAGARQVLLDEPHALERDAVGERMKAGRAVGLEAVHEGIQAGRRRDAGRQAHGELGIADDDAGHHRRMEDDLLLVRRLVDDHAGAAHFRARARRRRHRDHRRDAARICARPPVADVLEIPERARLPGHEGDDLAGIERRAAAEGDDAVVPALPVCGESRFDVGRDRIAAHAGEQPGARHQCARRAHHRRLAQSLVRHQQRAADAERCARGRQFSDAARAGPYLRWIVPVRLEDDAHVFTRRWKDFGRVRCS